MLEMAEPELERLLNITFGRMWHHYSLLNRPDGQKICYWCGAPETKRALVNIWGSVCDVGACDVCHEKNHGICRDSL